MKSFNLAYIDTKEDIINILNKSSLPVVAMQCLIKEIKEIIDLNAEQIIAEERKKEIEKEKEEDPT